MDNAMMFKLGFVTVSTSLTPGAPVPVCSAIENAEIIMHYATLSSQRPNPKWLHGLSTILEAEEAKFLQTKVTERTGDETIFRLRKLIRKNVTFFSLISSSYLSGYSTDVHAASARLLMNCFSKKRCSTVFNDDVKNNIKNWVMRADKKKNWVMRCSSDDETYLDFQTLKTYSTGFLAWIWGRGQPYDAISTPELFATLMQNFEDAATYLLGEAETEGIRCSDIKYEAKVLPSVLPNISALTHLRVKYSCWCIGELAKHPFGPEPLFYEKGADTFIVLLKLASTVSVSIRSPLLSDLLKLMRKLVYKPEFCARFVERGGIENLVAAPKAEENTYTDILIFLKNLCSRQDAVERINSLPLNRIQYLVKLAINVLKICTVKSLVTSASFFAATFASEAILDEFDARNNLEKLLAVLAYYQNYHEDMPREEKYTALYTCLAVRQYFRAHVRLYVKSICPSESVPMMAAVPFYISDKVVDDFLLEQQDNGELDPNFMSTKWPALDKFLASSGHVTMLELCQIPVDSDFIRMHHYAFGVLHIVSSIHDGVKAIVSTTLRNNRAGFAVIMDAVDISDSIVDRHLGIVNTDVIIVDPKIIQLALNILKNLVGRPQSLIKKPPLAQNPWSVPYQAPARPFTDKRFFLGAEAVLKAVGIRMLLNFFQPRSSLQDLWENYQNKHSYERDPIPSLDCLQALACRVLLGLARDEKFVDILNAFQVDKKVADLIRDLGGQSSGKYHQDISQVARELFKRLISSGKDIELTDSEVASALRASDADATTLTVSDAGTTGLQRRVDIGVTVAGITTYDEKAILLLIHQHLRRKGLSRSAAQVLELRRGL